MDYYDNGNLKQVQDPNGAIADYSKAIELKPDFAEAYCRRAFCKREIKDYIGAIADCSKAIELKPDFAEAYDLRAFCKREIKDYIGAIADYSKSIELYYSNIDSDLYNNYVKELNRYSNSKCYSKHQMKDIKRIIYGKYINAMDGNKFMVAYTYVWRGRSKHEINDYVGAIADFSKAIETSVTLYFDKDFQSHLAAYYYRGESKCLLKDYRGAIADYRKAIELIMPEQDNTNYFKGIQKGLLKAYKGAIADYRKEIELKPNFEDTFYYLVNSKYPSKCYSAIPSARTKKDELALNKYNMACDKVSSKNYRGAIADYSKAIALDPNFGYAYNNRGFCKHQLKDYKGAIADYSIAIKFRPNTADAYNNRGSSKDEIKDYRGAIADYSKAIELKPDNADAYYNRGNSKILLKDYNGAIIDYSKAIELIFYIKNKL